MSKKKHKKGEIKMNNENIEEIVNTNEMEIKPEDQPAVELDGNVNLDGLVGDIDSDADTKEDLTGENIPAPSDDSEGTITGCAKLNVRKEASKTANIVGVLNEGDSVMVNLEESTEDFYKVYTITVEGYCMKQFVSIK